MSPQAVERWFQNFLKRLDERSPLLRGEEEAIVRELLAGIGAAPEMFVDSKGRRVWPSTAHEPYSSNARTKPRLDGGEYWPVAPYRMAAAYVADKSFANLGFKETAPADSDPRLRAAI